MITSKTPHYTPAPSGKTGHVGGAVETDNEDEAQAAYAEYLLSLARGAANPNPNPDTGGTSGRQEDR